MIGIALGLGIVFSVAEGLLALIGLWTVWALLRHHGRELKKGVKEGRCGAQHGGHAMQPWLMRCKHCLCEETIEEAEPRWREQSKQSP